MKRGEMTHMQNRKPDVRANITLTRKSPVVTGYRPAHLIGDYLTTGVQKYVNITELHHGETAEGFITFITPEYYPHSLEVGMRIQFQEGSRMTGYADILEIYNDLLLRK